MGLFPVTGSSWALPGFIPDRSVTQQSLCIDLRLALRLPTEAFSLHSNSNGQCGRKGSCEPPGGNPLSASLARGSATGSLGGGSPEVHTGLSYIRGGKHTGRLAQPSLSRPGGVATESGYVPRDHTPLREPTGRPLCHSRQSSTGSVLLKVPSPGGGGHRRPAQPLAPRPPLCLPSHSNNTQGYQEDAEGTGGTHLAGSTLALAPVVCGPGGSLSGSPVETSSDQDLAQPRAADSSGPSVVQADRLALERSLLRKRHVPANVANTIQVSRRSSTIRIYGSTWRTFYTWCSSKNIDPTTASTITILIFLQHGLEQGLAANTLRRQVAAFSSILTCGAKRSLAHRPLIRQFLRGATNLCPPVVHRYPSWDLTKVLTSFTKGPFEPLRECGLSSSHHFSSQNF
ncbi:uncharacterized protein LOC131202545 [Ahaetulla prasina]|uniref:uncharacterized protein LOC131202545 n=1 Tax=Ahaetulla prasina TaxID=499056 RepID=UPI0026482941|nr:uncharacterized protein LOC131202545 [Ahaetulla prasina]